MVKSNIETFQKALCKLEEQRRDIYQTLRSIIPSGMIWTIESGHIFFNTEYFDSNHDTWTNLTTPLAEKLAFEVQDYDHPTSYSDGKRFCEFMNFSQKQTEIFLASCSYDEAYEAWANEERRAYSW